MSLLEELSESRSATAAACCSLVAVLEDKREKSKKFQKQIKVGDIGQNLSLYTLAPAPASTNTTTDLVFVFHCNLIDQFQTSC